MNSISLTELNQQIKRTLKTAFVQPIWVRAEISELHENAGHCYLELVEKDELTDNIISRQKATIWSFTYRMLKPYFESATLMQLREGLNVLLLVQIEFHEVYGMSLNVKDIDPTYTVGEMARRRTEIIKKLTEDGVIDLNKRLVITSTPQRIAVISSITAAGYGDFYNQLTNNNFGYKFYIKLFPAVMQGAQTEQSVIAALDKINEFIDEFDVVVIIRGGGSTTDLAAFDNYNIALNCSQFPLPIISGIGHERDDTIVDIVANTRVKTPTAAAEFLIEKIHETEEYAIDLAEKMAYMSKNIIQHEIQHYHSLMIHFPKIVNEKLYKGKKDLQTIVHMLELDIKQKIATENNKISIIDATLVHLSPLQILKRGYTLTQKNGHSIKSIKNLKAEDSIETIFFDGNTLSIITKINHHD